VKRPVLLEARRNVEKFKIDVEVPSFFFVLFFLVRSWFLYVVAGQGEAARMSAQASRHAVPSGDFSLGEHSFLQMMVWPPENFDVGFLAFSRLRPARTELLSLSHAHPAPIDRRNSADASGGGDFPPDRPKVVLLWVTADDLRR